MPQYLNNFTVNPSYTGDIYFSRLFGEADVFAWINVTEPLGKDSGLVGYWKLNNQSSYGENDTHVYDSSGSGNNCTFYGLSDSDSGPTASGKFGGAFMFDAIDDANDDRLDCGTDTSLHFTGNQSRSWGAWFYPQDNGGDQIIIDKGGGALGKDAEYALWIDSDEWICIRGNGSTYDLATTSGDSVDYGAWAHVMCVLNDTGLYVFEKAALGKMSATMLHIRI